MLGSVGNNLDGSGRITGRKTFLFLSHANFNSHFDNLGLTVCTAVSSFQSKVIENDVLNVCKSSLIPIFFLNIYRPHKAVLTWALNTFTCDSVSSGTVRAASTPEGPGDGGLTGNTREAGRVSTGHMVRWFDPGREVGVQLLYAGRSSVDSGGLLWRRSGLSPRTGDGGFWSCLPVGGSSGRGGRR